MRWDGIGWDGWIWTGEKRVQETGEALKAPRSGARSRAAHPVRERRSLGLGVAVERNGDR
ncbi:MAG: hypothetical protein LQ351_006889 [Letrouitia transgressa]|nr:MAG: hypothetical protein LQ351_006889 [Letrouitia transgressa]